MIDRLLIIYRDFLEAPRRSAATPNPAGTLAIFTLSSYSFESHHSGTGSHALDLNTGRSIQLPLDDETTSHTWTGFDSELIWQVQVEKGTEFWIGDVGNFFDDLKSRFDFLPSSY